MLKGADPAELPAGATREEKAAAKDQYLSEFLAERGKRDRQAQAWELLLTRSYDEPPTWQRIFDDLSPEVHDRTGHALRRPAGRRAGGVRAPVRGTLSGVSLGSRRAPMTRSLTAPGHLVAGRYRLESQIGGGGMGAVWLARDERLGRQVAIKQVLSPPGASAEEADQQRQRALREGRIAARLSHPHAISVYDVALEAGQPWLVMEYLPSRSLGEVLAEDGVLRGGASSPRSAPRWPTRWPPPTRRASCTATSSRRTSSSARAARSRAWSRSPTSASRTPAGDVTLTRPGRSPGRPAYLAPEVAQGYEMTAASDVFSLGATLYACLEGAAAVRHVRQRPGHAAPGGRGRDHPAAALGRH